MCLNLELELGSERSYGLDAHTLLPQFRHGQRKERKSTRTVNTTATLKTTGAKAIKEYLIALLVPVTMLSTKHDVAVLPRYAETTRHI